MGIRPFSSGSQHYDWRASNCDRCTKYNHDPNLSKCDIDKAILAAACGRDMTEEMATRMGYFENNGKDGFSYVWMCPEVKWTKEWKEEFKRKDQSK